MIPLILLGGGGHCKSCIDVIESIGNYKILGILDLKEKFNSTVLNYTIIGVDDDISKFIPRCNNFFITIGHIKNPLPRILSFQILKNNQVTIPIVISPNAYVSRYAQVGEGTIIMHQAVVNADAKIGKNSIINTGAVIEHDTRIGDHTHISTGAYINGGCTIGDRVFIGSSAVIANNLSIANDIVIGAGTVVIHPIFESGTYVGNPARKIL